MWVTEWDDRDLAIGIKILCSTVEDDEKRNDNKKLNKKGSLNIVTCCTIIIMHIYMPLSSYQETNTERSELAELA